MRCARRERHRGGARTTCCEPPRSPGTRSRRDQSTRATWSISAESWSPSTAGAATAAAASLPGRREDGGCGCSASAPIGMVLVNRPVSLRWTSPRAEEETVAGAGGVGGLLGPCREQMGLQASKGRGSSTPFYRRWKRGGKPSSALHITALACISMHLARLRGLLLSPSLITLVIIILTYIIFDG